MNPDMSYSDNEKSVVEVRVVTPEQARQWLQSRTYKRQRTVRRHHVLALAQEMKKETFIQNTTIRFAEWGGQNVLLDGQHRLHAVVQSGIAQRFVVVTEAIPNEERIAYIYGKSDRNLRRTSGDMYAAIGLDEELALPRNYLTQVSAAVRFINIGLTTYRRSGAPQLDEEVTIQLIRDYGPQAQEYYDMIKKANKPISNSLRRYYVVAIGLLSLKYAKESGTNRVSPSVYSFWNGAIYDDRIPANDPRKAANRHFLMTVMDNAQGLEARERHIESITPNRGARYLAACFTHYMNGKTPKKIIIQDENAPFAMWGVPERVTRRAA
jgi:hypothetical protein